MRPGGKVLIDQLEAEGVERVFLVPGESFLAVLDALHGSRIETIVCRHEGGAAMMAEATGKLTGRPGVALVTRGPGAANAVAGVYVAAHDETPMVLLVGLPPRELEDAAPFQDIDLGLFAGLAKEVAIVRETERLPEAIARAFATALSGRPGPVVVGLPEDVLRAETPAVAVRPRRIGASAPGRAEMDELSERLRGAEWPILIVGGPGWSAEVGAAIAAFAQNWDMPVASAFRCQDYIDNRHPSYVGHLGLAPGAKLAAGLRGADVVLVVGAHLGEVTTGGGTLIASPEPKQLLIHVRAAGDHAESACRASLPITAALSEFAAALRTVRPPAERPWTAVRRDLRAAYEAALRPAPVPGEISFAEVVRHVSDTVADNAIVANGAGNYAGFVQRYFVYKRFRTQLAPASGSMGYGLPAAIAAKLAHPERPVVAFAGDGCLQMTVQELATAVQYALPIVVIIADNGMHGTIRMHQERAYPGRVIGTSLVNPDFAALAKSYGAGGETVTRIDAFKEAFARALRADAPHVICVKVDPEAISPDATIASLRRGKGKS